MPSFAAVRVVVVCLAAGLGAATAFGQSAAPVVGTAWDKGPPFDGGADKPKKIADVRGSLSGAACVPAAPPMCLAALDEGQTAQFFTIAGKTLVPGRVIRLLPENDGWLGFKEVDTEGVAYADGYFYLIGSHGLGRKSEKFQRSSFFAFRFPVDPSNGRPRFEFSADAVAPAIQRSAVLRDVLQAAPDVGPFAEKPLSKGDGGVNIEGIAVRGNRMFLGLRGPSIKLTEPGDSGFIVSVNIDGVFEGKQLAPAVHRLPLGPATGIRDLAAVRSGLLVLAGPVQEDGPYAIHHWNPDSGVLTKLQLLKMPDKGAKAETILVLEDAGPRYSVLLLYDGLEDGGPHELEVRMSGQ